MKKSVSSMQGTPAYLETHYEAMAYYHQDKKICHYCYEKICGNVNSTNYKKQCIGYTKCSDFISDESYEQKMLKELRKKGVYKNSTNNIKKPKKKPKSEKCKKINTYKSRNETKSNLQKYALGDDPRIKEVFTSLKKNLP